MFDLIVLLILAVSAFIGFVRGAVREVVTVIAFVISILLAILLLRFTGPLFRHAIHPDWLASAAALIVIFLAMYIALRVLGAHMTERVKKTRHLGMFDRVVGLGFGLIRALVTLGLFNIVFHIATPPERTPKWVTEANLYPLTEVSAKALRAIAPKGSAIANRVAPALKDAVVEGSKGDNDPDRRYEARDRSATNDSLEISR
jgi:membrane protein required for colicin V production